MSSTLKNTASVIALISIGRSNVQAVGETVAAAQSELDSVIGETSRWIEIDAVDADDSDYRVLRLPAGDWTGSDADAERAHAVGEIVTYYQRLDPIRVENFRIELWEDVAAAIYADVDGVEEIEWLDVDGDIETAASHLSTNRGDVYDDDDIAFIHAAMQEYIDDLDGSDRAELDEILEAASAAKAAA